MDRHAPKEYRIKVQKAAEWTHMLLRITNSNKKAAAVEWTQGLQNQMAADAQLAHVLQRNHNHTWYMIPGRG